MPRLDKYLNVIAGESEAAPAPVTRLDKSLARIANGEGDSPPLIAPIDTALDGIGGGGTTIASGFVNITADTYPHDANSSFVIEHNLGRMPVGVMWVIDSVTQSASLLPFTCELITADGYTQANANASKYEAGDSNFNALLAETDEQTMRIWGASLPNRYNKTLTAGTVIRWFVW